MPKTTMGGKKDDGNKDAKAAPDIGAKLEQIERTFRDARDDELMMLIYRSAVKLTEDGKNNY